MMGSVIRLDEWFVSTTVLVTGKGFTRLVEEGEEYEKRLKEPQSEKDKVIRYRRGNLGTLCLVARRATIVSNVPSSSSGETHPGFDGRSYRPLQSYDNVNELVSVRSSLGT